MGFIHESLPATKRMLNALWWNHVIVQIGHDAADWIKYNFDIEF
jgi:hypothetical protein